MKKFVELIQRVHQENFNTVVSRIIAEKIPVAFLAIDSFERAITEVNNLRTQGLNVTNLICANVPQIDFQSDFAITHIDKILQIHPRPEYIFTASQDSSQYVVKYAPYLKQISLEVQEYNEAYESFMTHLEELQEVYESLIDEESRKTFYGYWLGNISNQFAEFFCTNDEHYLTAGFIPPADSVVIDGGVLDGRTSAMYSDLGCKVYAFEMDKINFENSKRLSIEKGFVLENLGLGAFNHEMNYIHAPWGNPGASRLNKQGNEVAKIVSLDSYVREHHLPRVDCIKLDVEGAELDVLKGAVTTIARDKPILVISAYHKWDDFWTLMNFVKSVRPDYEWALRQYVDTPQSAPRWFDDKKISDLMTLGLDVMAGGWKECCLLAR